MKRMNGQNKTGKKLTGSIAAIAILSVCLFVTTFALIYSSVVVDDNIFGTGEVKINLNDGNPIIREDEFMFAPGMTVQKDFFLENLGSTDVYYRLYFDNVSGELSEFLDITIKDGDKILYSGKADELSEENAVAAREILKPNERRNLTVTFYYPENCGNGGQSSYLSFDLKAEAVQAKNNPDRLFD